MASKRTCRRCGGSKVYPLPGGRLDTCWGCGGTGVQIILTAAERAEQADAFRREEAARIAVVERAKILAAPAGVPDFEFPQIVRRGFNMLRDNEPERLVKLYASLDAGRIDDIVYALYAYRTAHTN